MSKFKIETSEGNIFFSNEGAMQDYCDYLRGKNDDFKVYELTDLETWHLIRTYC